MFLSGLFSAKEEFRVSLSVCGSPQGDQLRQLLPQRRAVRFRRATRGLQATQTERGQGQSCRSRSQVTFRCVC